MFLYQDIPVGLRKSAIFVTCQKNLPKLIIVKIYHKILGDNFIGQDDCFSR